MDTQPNAVSDMHTKTQSKSKSPDPTTLGGRLRLRRKELGWTQTELATMVGTSQAVIQKIENGKSLRPRILEEIAEALGVRPSWLMFGVQEVGGLEPEALELARAWSKLQEPYRSALREAILKIGSEARYA